MRRISELFFWVPNTITALNLASGSMAVFLGIEGELGLAAIFILAAAVFDFFDGMAARLLGAYSEIGKQLDSLADLVSFGLAPAAMLFTMLQLAMFGQNQAITSIDASILEWIFLLSALLVPVAGAFRLAKFNLDTRQSENFLGLPIPANAIFYASLALILQWGSVPVVANLILNRFNLLTAIALLSALMISELPMFSLKFKHLKWQGNQIRFLFIGLCLILVISLKLYAVPLIIISYILISAVLKLTNR
ncbi:CDP-alcohol phosphatidyltransferase family protein [Sunxiuqinia elliptica]|uniref:CDP-diacylglycerol--serine O-phosphatidyltransferase n=1 Tax=Sunxiuqinia elliptica TaxID=655355 RepID=A0A4R6GMS1_9BACT|nr:CDP-alcohol phosphatidyltransferase family protein [Sunxiuqinia elliptica]TDN96267.1 CDP-diacylglycerol--serine O-phosphatidyltransferase [Sunxiuqinia elliptica]TDO67978.1 CDP-diacylglycerol--serine O-phosphatidyltransferase [Sunxiuqinia elliptica]